VCPASGVPLVSARVHCLVTSSSQDVSKGPQRAPKPGLNDRSLDAELPANLSRTPAVPYEASREVSLAPEPTNVDMRFTAVSDGRWIAASQASGAAAAAYIK
jgi:hypothetical protein